MSFRACLLSSLLVAPAWAQEPATPPPPETPRSFDLRSDAVRKIVHATASSQSVPVQVSRDAPVKRDSDAVIRYEPPEKPSVVKEISPPPVAAPPADDFLSAIIGTVVDTAVESLIDTEPDDAMRKQYDLWRACHEKNEDCALPPPPPAGTSR